MNGSEYFNLMPVWDWDKLPGVTAFPGATQVVRHAFTGSAGDGESGLTAMDYELIGPGGQRLTARKSWACHNGWVVCLIGGIRDSGGTGPVYTAIDQCRWKGSVTVGRRASETVLHEGERTLDGVCWMRHGTVTALFLQPARVDIHAGAATGSWADINTSGSPAPVTEKVFLPVLLHGADTAAAYALTAGLTLAETRSLARRPPFAVLRNDRDIQAVRFRDGMVLAAFYSAGTLPLAGGKTLAADRPCLVLASKKISYLWPEGDGVHLR
jgi:chondroitin AC lyase